MTRRAAVPAVVSLALALAGCGGSGHADQAAPGPVSSPTATARAVAAAPSTDVLAGEDVVTPGATAMPARPTNAPTSSSKKIAATAGPTASPIPLVLDPKAVYDDWTVAQVLTRSIVLNISSNSCHGGPQITVDETPSVVTILITEQLFGPADCHGVLKIVREVAALHAPIGKRYLQGCRPMQEKAGVRVNCRTVTPPT